MNEKYIINSQTAIDKIKRVKETIKYGLKDHIKWSGMTFTLDRNEVMKDIDDLISFIEDVHEEGDNK